jgi:hypothetical protein
LLTIYVVIVNFAKYCRFFRVIREGTIAAGPTPVKPAKNEINTVLIDISFVSPESAMLRPP